VSASVGPFKISGAPHAQRDAAALAVTGSRSPLEQLLHALNQPLTGLQCSMEVALASPRTAEQYVHGLREGLALTERMRALVDAIREVVDGEDETNEEQETIDLKAVLREVVDDLEPVAQAKSVLITIECSADSSLWAKAGRRRLAAAVFRLLESALSVAAPGSALRIEMGGAPAEGRIRIRWFARQPRSEFSRPELGLLVAQAGWEQAGAEWTRERAENLETVTVRLPDVSAGLKNPAGGSR
jgi:signal transduction histidine kinase